MPTMGLSPRVRGNLFIQSGTSYTIRSIPAGAGEPGGQAGASLVKDQVYPRGCGGTNLRLLNAGLSPRVRGNLAHGWRRYAVYPRGCGGTKMIRPKVSNSQGLSPRVRGNLVDAVMRPCRSIPAGAGETLMGSFSALRPIPAGAGEPSGGPCDIM